MWAALGADVVVAEPADGHLLRHLPPFAPGRTGPEASLWWAFFGQGKRSVVAPPGSAARAELLATADVVIADVDPAADEPALGPRPPGRGRRQPVRPDRAAPRLEGLGAGRLGVGRHRVHHRVPGPGAGRARPRPSSSPSHVTSLVRASTRRCSALRGVRHDRPRPGGRRVDAGVLPVAGAGDRRGAVPRRRPPPRPPRQPARRHPAVGPVPVRRRLRVVPRPAAGALAGDGGVDRRGDRASTACSTRSSSTSTCAGRCRTSSTTAPSSSPEPRTKLDLFIEGQRRGIPITPVNTVADLCNDPHLRSAGFWREEQHPILGAVRRPGRRSASTTTGGSGRPRPRSASTPDPLPSAGQPRRVAAASAGTGQRAGTSGRSASNGPPTPCGG